MLSAAWLNYQLPIQSRVYPYNGWWLYLCLPDFVKENEWKVNYCLCYIYMFEPCRGKHAGQPPHADKWRCKRSTSSPVYGLRISLHPSSTLQPRPQPRQVLHPAVARQSHTGTHIHVKHCNGRDSGKPVSADIDGLSCKQTFKLFPVTVTRTVFVLVSVVVFVMSLSQASLATLENCTTDCCLLSKRKEGRLCPQTRSFLFTFFFVHNKIGHLFSAGQKKKKAFIQMKSRALVLRGFLWNTDMETIWCSQALNMLLIIASQYAENSFKLRCFFLLLFHAWCINAVLCSIHPSLNEYTPLITLDLTRVAVIWGQCPHFYESHPFLIATFLCSLPQIKQLVLLGNNILTSIFFRTFFFPCLITMHCFAIYLSLPPSRLFSIAIALCILHVPLIN